MKTETRTLVSCYLLLQAAAVAAWWLAISTRPGFAELFVSPQLTEQTLPAFWLADLLMVVAASLAAALMVRRGGGRRLVWLISGGLLYATLFCLAATLALGQGWLGTGLMLAASAGTLFCAKSLEVS